MLIERFFFTLGLSASMVRVSPERVSRISIREAISEASSSVGALTVMSATTVQPGESVPVTVIEP